MIVILAKLALGLGGALLGALLASHRRAHEISNRRFDALAIGLGAGSRLALFLAVYVVLGIDAQSDISGYYYPEAQSALAGKLVYRDFKSSYAPLFPYVAAAAVFAWRSGKSIILLAILAEALAVPLWLRSARALLGERAARTATILYVCSALPLINVVFDGQNQSYCALFFALSVSHLAAGRPFLSGLAAGASLSVVKLIAVLHAPAPFAAAGRGRLHFLLGAALLPLVTYGGFTLAGADVLAGVRNEAGLHSSGNIPFLLTAAFGRVTALGPAPTIILALALLSLVGWALVTRAASEPRAMFAFGALVLLTFMIVSKKSYTHYLVIGFFPLAATVAARAPSFRIMLAFGLFGALAAVEPSLWFRWINAGDLGLLSHPTAAVPRARVLAFLACDLALVTAYVILWQEAYRLLTRPLPSASTPAIEPST